MTERALSLLGRDLPDLGPIALVGLPDGGALALSRGQAPKPYRHVDPNEDAALLVRVADGALLAVADGHHGARASELALEALTAHAERLVRAPDFGTAMGEMLRALGPRLREAPRSRTYLLAARFTAGACAFACFGDSSLHRSAAVGAASQPNDLALGSGVSPEIDGVPQVLGGFALAPGERVAAVTDGVTNFMDVATIPEVLRGAADDLSAARALAEIALRGGAGDNVAVAVLCP